MPAYFNKDEIKEQLEIENVFDLIVELGGEPEYTDSGIICQTICHNPPGEGSRKLYYYSNSHLFRCYTHCDDSFDIFELVIKCMDIQKNLNWELYDAMYFIASFFGIEGVAPPDEENNLIDWEIFKRHEFEPFKPVQEVHLNDYSPIILTRFAYPRISQWEAEGISKETCRKNLIGYYAGGEQITIPHFDENGRLVGIRGRYLATDDADRFGKYRPLFINNQLYNHPLSMNLYNLNKSKDNIKTCKTAIIFESEKSCLMYKSYYGEENDISVACCGSSISSYQMYLLKKLGVREIVIAFDRQFQNLGDDEFKRLKRKLIGINKKYGTDVLITAIFDKDMLTPYKASPIDLGPKIFEKLLSERFTPAN